MAKKKPLPAAARSAIRRLAAAFVCAELELQVVAKFVEEKRASPMTATLLTVISIRFWIPIQKSAVCGS